MGESLNTIPSASSEVRLIWHRRDLRLHDNWLYTDLEQSVNESGDPTKEVVSLYVFDDKDFQPRPSTCRPNEWDAINVGPHAARILLHSVKDLRRSLRSIGGELLISKGSPISIVPEILQQINATEIYWNEEPGIDEQQQSKSMRSIIEKQFPRVKIRNSMQYTLYHPDDLPYGGIEWEQLSHPKKTKRKKRRKQQSPERTLQQEEGKINIESDRWKGMSKIMGDFRKAAREKTAPRACLPTPVRLNLPNLSKINIRECPTIEELMQDLLLPNNNNASPKKKPILGLPHELIANVVKNAINNENSLTTKSSIGGERVALDHLSNFLKNHASTATRNLACVSNNESSRISHYLSFGCLSPRKIIEEAEKHGDDCKWVISHMTMRDFFLYTCIASGSAFYQLEGIPVSKKIADTITWKSFESKDVRRTWVEWASGNTGLPLVDAAMKELISTGYCSNRVRQNAASVLTKDLGIDWRAGAELFQFLLEDHCVGANWGNWLYFSGVGPDPKQRHFRTVSQALKYDKNGSYVRRWLPELNKLQEDEAYLRPWDFCDDWTKLIVNPESQYTWHDLERLKNKGKLISLES